MQTITPDLLRRYDRAGPRYTSYPTAAEFDAGVGPDEYAARLERAAARAERALSLYAHLPFCDERCHYCGCNVVITRRRDVARRYLEFLEREIRAVGDRLGERRGVRQLHFGGGTPTYYEPDELVALHGIFAEVFEIEPDAEQAIEIDPRVTTPGHLRALASVGFNRLSLGIQDFTPEVQEAVNRVQAFEQTRMLADTARELGFLSINVDLIYGLPRQAPETFGETLAQVLEIRPERVAVYSYAHMPWIKSHQRLIDAAELPSADAKLEIFAKAVEAFRGAGYRAIGMDHFALPDDDLGRAVEDGTLWRNFMGYTVQAAPDMVAFGLSAISDVEDAFVQNERKLSRYEQAIAAGRLPTERGYVLSEDDKIRRHVITALMCAFRLDIADVERRFGIDFRTTFAAEWEALGALERDGFVRRREGGIDVVGLGRQFVRNVCMVFDTYLDAELGGPPRFSRTV